MIITVINKDNEVMIFKSKMQTAKYINISLRQFYNIIDKNKSTVIQYKEFIIYLNCRIINNIKRGKKGF